MIHAHWIQVCYYYMMQVSVQTLSSQLNSIRGNSAHHDYKRIVEDIKLIFLSSFFFTYAETKKNPTTH